MTAVSLGGRREDRFRQAIRFLQALAADRFRTPGPWLLYSFHADPEMIASHDALHGKHVRARHDHRTSLQLVGILSAAPRDIGSTSAVTR